MSRKHPTRDIVGRVRRLTGLNINDQMARAIKQEIMGDAQEEHVREFQTLKTYAKYLGAAEPNAWVKVCASYLKVLCSSIFRLTQLH
jgi:hypothetical protein